MHTYYAENIEKFRAGMDKYLSLVSSELESTSGKKYVELFEEIWDYCDFKLKIGAEVLPYWPPVFSQDNPYK